MGMHIYIYVCVCVCVCVCPTLSHELNATQCEF